MARPEKLVSRASNARAASRVRCEERCSAARWAAAPEAPTVVRRADNDLDEVWIEPTFADEIDCACVSHLERTLFVVQAGDAYNGGGRLPPPDLARGLDAVHHR
jgi:hypothetical protein